MDLHEGILEADAPGADRLDLAADQGDPGLEAVEDLVVVEGLFILGDGLPGR
jgi:hypothetical protein